MAVTFTVRESNRDATVSALIFCRKMGIMSVKLITDSCGDMVKWWRVIGEVLQPLMEADKRG